MKYVTKSLKKRLLKVLLIKLGFILIKKESQTNFVVIKQVLIIVKSSI